MAFRIVYSQAMAQILGVLCFMQLVVYLPLIGVKFPPSALMLYEKIISIISFDLLPTDDDE